MKKLLLATCLLLSMLAAAPAAWPAYERRNEALQLYQEGLFQETGTGDLASAEKIYTTLTEHYEDYRDIASVAWYHLGLVYEKQGRVIEARRCFNLILVQYPDQTLLIRQAQLKLDADSRPTPAPAPVIQAAKPAAPAAPAQPMNVSPTSFAGPTGAPAAPALPVWGVGLHYLGVHANCRLTNQLLLEADASVNSDILTTGLRLLLPIRSRWNRPEVNPYWGLETDWLFKSSSSAGYRAGCFFGLEIFPLPQLGIYTDVGSYYRNVPSDFPESIRNDLGINVGTTYYF